MEIKVKNLLLNDWEDADDGSDEDCEPNPDIEYESVRYTDDGAIEIIATYNHVHADREYYVSFEGSCEFMQALFHYTFMNAKNMDIFWSLEEAKDAVDEFLLNIEKYETLLNFS